MSAKPVDIVLVQMYMPTTNHDDDEIEKLYEEISDILHQEGRGQMNGGRLQQHRGRRICQ